MAANPDTFDFTDASGHAWTFYAPIPPSTVWTASLKEAAYGRNAGIKLVAADGSDALTLRVQEFSAAGGGGADNGGYGTLDVHGTIEPDPTAAKSGGGGMFLFLLVVAYYVDKKYSRGSR